MIIRSILPNLRSLYARNWKFSIAKVCLLKKIKKIVDLDARIICLYSKYFINIRLAES